MNRNAKKIVALAFLVSAMSAVLPTSASLTTIKAMASTEIEGVESLKVCKGDSSTSLTMYKDSDFKNSTKFKDSISKYYVKLSDSNGKFNIDGEAEDDYTMKVFEDGDEYDLGDPISVARGNSSDVKVKVYDDDDDLVSTITIKVTREDDSDSSNEDKEEASSTNTNNSNNASIVDGKVMATATDVSNTSYYDYTSGTGNSSYGVNVTGNGNVKNQWIKNGLYWQYYDNSGNLLRNKWHQDQSNGKWYYLQTNGYMTTGWRFIDGDWYYFDKSGVMKTGWIKDINEKWYYLTSKGNMVRSSTIDGYTLNARGELIN